MVTATNRPSCPSVPCPVSPCQATLSRSIRRVQRVAMCPYSHQYEEPIPRHAYVIHVSVWLLLFFCSQTCHVELLRLVLVSEPSPTTKCTWWLQVTPHMYVSVD